MVSDHEGYVCELDLPVSAVTEEVESDIIQGPPKKKKKVPAQKTTEDTAARLLDLEVEDFKLKRKLRLLDIEEREKSIAVLNVKKTVLEAKLQLLNLEIQEKKRNCTNSEQ